MKTQQNHRWQYYTVLLS